MPSTPPAGPGLTQLTTEAARPGLEDLDLQPTPIVVSELLQPLSRLPAMFAAAEPTISLLVDRIVDRMRRGGRLIIAGAGTSGQLARNEAMECVPTFGLEPGRVIALVAGGFDVAGTAFDSAEDDEHAARRDIDELGVGEPDVLLGISASGRTPYVLEALAQAARLGADTLGLTNNEATELAALCTHTLVLETGPEVPAGSTRMAAGTAQKVALNTLTTGAMIKLGRTFGSWMIDVATTNEKLRHRAVRIIAESTGHDLETAARADRDTGHDVAAAIFMLRTGVDGPTAVSHLAACNGRLREALTRWPATPS